MQDNLIHALKKRNLIAQISHENELVEYLDASTDKSKVCVYAGFDPTASSLHVGNLAVLMCLRRAQQAGLTPIILFGGATGLIGDPTGRTEMRPMKTPAEIQDAINNFQKLVAPFFKTEGTNQPIYVNNLDWVAPMSWLDFARNVGVHFTVARLLSAEVNKTRLQEGGLTFMELGYQLIQSYDFLHLFEKYQCAIQFGGDDQWSNILGGADLVRRTKHQKAFAVTTPLLVDKNGSKFGKSAGNAIWLDGSMTSPYEFFQFFRNVLDEDVKRLFHVFSHRSLEEIDSLFQNKSINECKEILAGDVTTLVHGKSAAEQSLKTAQGLFAGGGGLPLNLPTTEVTQEELEAGLDMLGLLVKCKLSSSRGEARKLIQGGGLTVNQTKWTECPYPLSAKDFEGDQGYLLIRKGKKEYHKVVLKQ